MRNVDKPKIFDVDIIGMAALIALAAGTWFFFVRPVDGRIAALETERRRSLEQKSSYEQELQRLNELQVQRERIVAQFRAGRNILDLNTGMADVVEQLGGFADDHALILDELTPGAATDYEHFRFTPLDLRLTGAFPDVARFLHSLAEGLPYVRVHKLTVAARPGMAQVGPAAEDDGAREALCTAAIQLHVFSY